MISYVASRTGGLTYLGLSVALSARLNSVRLPIAGEITIPVKSKITLSRFSLLSHPVVIIKILQITFIPSRGGRANSSVKTPREVEHSGESYSWHTLIMCASTGRKDRERESERERELERAKERV